MSSHSKIIPAAEVIREFLKAESSPLSNRFSDKTRAAIARVLEGEEIESFLSAPVVSTDDPRCQSLNQALGINRPTMQSLITDSTVSWREEIWDRDRVLSQVRFIHWGHFMINTDNSRLSETYNHQRALSGIHPQTNDHIIDVKSISEHINNIEKVPPLIILESNGKFTCLEGNGRLMSLPFVTKNLAVTVLIGSGLAVDKHEFL